MRAIIYANRDLAERLPYVTRSDTPWPGGGTVPTISIHFDGDSVTFEHATREQVEYMARRLAEIAKELD